MFSLITEHGNGQGPIKNISDPIITLAACKMNQIVSVGLTNGLVFFNFVPITGVVASVCVIFGYFLLLKSKDVAGNLFLTCPLISVVLLF